MGSLGAVLHGDSGAPPGLGRQAPRRHRSGARAVLPAPYSDRHGVVRAEYAYTLRVDEKTDVYSFGVVLLELVTGRRPLGDFGDEIDLVHWAQSVVPRPTDTAAVLAVADPRLPAGLIARLFRVGISCVRDSSQARPTMRDVVHVLSSFVVPPADPACSVCADDEACKSQDDRSQLI